VKPTSLLLLASLLANLALVAFVATRSTPPSTAPSQAGGAASSPVARQAAGTEPALHAALVSGQASALTAAGLDPALAREIALGRTLTRLAEKARAAKSGQPADGRWWRSSAANATGAREQQLLLRREFSDALVAALGEDFGLSSFSDRSSPLAFLPEAKRDALRRITQDYDEMMAKYSGGVQLASDREKLALLRTERERDIAALLSPEERLAYEMRTSPSSAMVRARYGDGLETEEDFRKIYALQKAFDDKFPMETLSRRNNPEGMKAFTEAQQLLQADIRAALGETGYANLRRATDADLRTVDSLVSRLNLPATTTDRVAAARDSFAVESQRINANTAASREERRAQIQALGTRAKSEIQQALGAEAAEAYAQRSPWVGMLQNGLAYSTTPQPGTAGAMLAGVGNQSVFPVMPAGAPAPGTARQMIISTTATNSDAGHGSGALSLGGLPGGVRENVQVMTFSTTTTESAAPPPAGTTVERTIIVAPPPPAPAPTAPPK
jgi:hypothetical protein